MKFRFWLIVFSLALACLLLAFFAGYAWEKPRENQKAELLLKRSAKLRAILFSKDIEAKLDFLLEEGQKIPTQGQISPESFFFAWVPAFKPEGALVSEEGFPPLLESRLLPFKTEGESPAPKGRTKSALKGDSAKKALVLSLYNKAFPKTAEAQNPLSAKPKREGKKETASANFYFKALQLEGKAPLALLIQEGRWAAFLKADKSFFAIPSSSFSEKGEAFLMDKEGQVFFHNEESKIFKRLSKKSPVWKALKPLPSNLKGRYAIKARGQGASRREAYYAQKWERGDMFLASKASSPYPLFSSIFLSPLFWPPLALAFALSLLALGFKISSLSSAYKFLKKAFISFSQTGSFPLGGSSKNPLLYFYNNRELFLNRRGEDKRGKASSKSLSFRDLISQELEELKARHPGLSAREKFDSDARLFGFERFLRPALRELLLNGLEAMAGLKDLRLDISLREEGEDLICSVRDYGPGASKPERDKFFQMYYSSKSQLGTGLNLAQSIAQANGGDLELSSPEGGGLTASLRLPMKCFLKNYFDKSEGEGF